jgi:hypothetical protein
MQPAGAGNSATAIMHRLWACRRTFPVHEKKAHQSVRFKYCFTFPVVWVRRCRLVAADSYDSTTSVKRVSPQYIPGINTVFIDHSPTNFIANSVFQPCYRGVYAYTCFPLRLPIIAHLFGRIDFFCTMTGTTVLVVN